MKIIQSKHKKEKKSTNKKKYSMKTEQLWENIKWSNIVELDI